MQTFTQGFFAKGDYVLVGIAKNYLEAFIRQSGSDSISARYNPAKAERNTVTDNSAEAARSAVNVRGSMDEQIELDVFF